MILRTCYGCTHEGQPCSARDDFKEALRGLGVTSVKWKCKARTPRFSVGDPVWALTAVGYGDDWYDDGGQVRDEFPATVIRVDGTKALVYIAPKTESRHGDYEFEPNGSGFCKIPLSRLTAREGDRQEVCRFCELPASYGHIEGYSCAYAISLQKDSNHA